MDLLGLPRLAPTTARQSSISEIREPARKPSGNSIDVVQMRRLHLPIGHIFIAPLLLLAVNASAQETPDFTGVWMPDRQQSGSWPSELPYTVAGHTAVLAFEENYPGSRDARGFTSLYDPGGFCVFPGMPTIMFGGGYWVEFIQRPERLTVIFELTKPTRRIYTDGRSQPEDLYPTENGHSIGQWDGDTLVVETIGIVPREGPIPNSKSLRIVEQLSIEPDETHGVMLKNEITIHDPVIFTEQVIVNQRFTPWPDDDLLEYQCTDGPWRDYLRELETRREHASE